MNMHLIEVKYIGASNTRGSRVKLTSLRFKDSVILPYDYKYNSALEIAEAWLITKMTRKSIIGSGEASNGDIIAVDVFEPLRNIKIGGV